jgi:hypothetical protein
VQINLESTLPVMPNLSDGAALDKAAHFQLSRLLTRTLRYETGKFKIAVDLEGWVDIKQLCEVWNHKQSYSLSQVTSVFQSQPSRFQLRGPLVRIINSVPGKTRHKHTKTDTPDYFNNSDVVSRTLLTETHTSAPALAEPPMMPCYPTDARVRQKAAQAAAGADRVVKKRVRTIEDHTDDCGNDLSGLSNVGSGVDVSSLLCECLPALLRDIEEDFDWDHSDSEAFLDTSPLFLFTGAGNISATRSVLTLQSFLEVAATLPQGIDIVELCGGVGRTSSIAVRRKLRVGPNYDLVAGYDLNSPADQDMVKAFFRKHRPLVAVMAPTCAPYGPMSNVNFSSNYDGWYRSWQNASPHARFCGEVALIQLRHGRYFLREQPFPTYMDEEPPWPTVRSHPSVRAEVIDQCQVGQTGPRGLPAKKPTEILANSPELLLPFRGLRCQDRHVHDSLEGGGGKQCQVWTCPAEARVRNLQGICFTGRRA